MRTADAHPTKDLLFVVLTRDIDLYAAILDLVDNSIDGARRKAPEGNYGESDLWVRLNFNGDSFVIEDSCGGIEIALAEHFAFKFGRDPNAPPTPHSVGQFGVGMKRALFKLGRNFSVESYHEDVGFRVDVDVDAWLSQPDLWTFSLEPTEKPKEAVFGTAITVSNLNPGPKEQLSDPGFESTLHREIERVHAYSLYKGLKITVNGKPCQQRLPQFLDGDNLQSGQMVYTIPPFTVTDKPIEVRLVAGVSKPKPDDERQERAMSEAGWYLFCNDRMVLEGDQGQKTGWGTVGIARWHPQYRHFRGFAFLNCEDASRLPWTTTKTDVVVDNPIYQSVRQRMVETMKPVMSFLDRLKTEKEQGAEDSQGDSLERPASEAIESSAVHVVESPASITANRPFNYAATTVKARLPKKGRIQYDRPIEKIKAVQKHTGLSSMVKVGEHTFDYFYRVEIEGDDGDDDDDEELE